MEARGTEGWERWMKLDLVDTQIDLVKYESLVLDELETLHTRCCHLTDVELHLVAAQVEAPADNGSNLPVQVGAPLEILDPNALASERVRCVAHPNAGSRVPPP